MKLKIFNVIACIGSTIALCLQPTQAEAIFASVKSTGMAATCIAYPLDSLVGAYNPAGMPEIGDRLDLEAGWVYDRGHTKVYDSPIPPVNGRFNGMRTHSVYPAAFGFNKNWCYCDWQFSTGLIVYNRNYQKTTYSQPQLLFGNTNLGLEYLNQTVSPVFAVSWRNQHSIGISVNYQVERVKVNGLQNFDNPVFSTNPGHVTNRGYNWSTGWGFTIGYYGHLTDKLSIGVTYQPETSMTRLKKYDGFLAQNGKLNIPRKIGAGISYKILPCLVVAFDYEHIHWKPVKALSNNLQNIFENPVENRLGSKNGPGFGFKDQSYFRFGIEWQALECLALRAGFRHANTPIKKSQTAVNVLTLDTVEDFLTCGATWNFTPCSELSAMFAWGFKNKITGKDSIPPVAPFNGGSVDIDEQKYALAVAFGHKF